MKNPITSKKDNKTSKRKGYEYILLLLLTISLFITATYAWFTDSAYSKGNKLFTGNLYIEVVATKEDLVNAGYSDVDADLVDEFGSPYHRTLTDGTETDYYYISNKDAHVVNLYNMEPGQFRKASVKYLNTGDLAFRTVGALKIDQDELGNNITYNGFEVLNKQLTDNTFGVYKNRNQITSAAAPDNSETINQIKQAQTIIDDKESTATVISINGVDCKVIDYMDANGKYSFENGYDGIAVKAYMITNDYESNLAYDETAQNYIVSQTSFCTSMNSSPSISNIANKLLESGLILKNDYSFSYNEHSVSKVYNGFSDMAQYVAGNSLSFSTENPEIYFAPIHYGVAVNKRAKFDSIVENSDQQNGYLYTNLIYRVDLTDDEINNPYTYAFCIVNNSGTMDIASKLLNESNICHVRPTFYVSLEQDVNPGPQTSSIDPKTIYEHNTDNDSENNFYDISYEGLDYTEYKHRFDKMYSRLEKYILHDDLSEDDNYKPIIELVPKENNGPTEYDEVLKGYLPKHFGDMSDVLEVYVTSNENEVALGHESDYYFGNLNEFSFMLANGPAADKTLSEATEIELDGDNPENTYKIMKDDPIANLYEDYQRYLSCASGYCLPIDCVTNSEHKVDPNTQMKVYSKSVYVDEYDLVDASELGTLEFMLYMPTDAGNEYQNCSISLSLGGTATQVSYEVDDLGIMIYDGISPEEITEDDDIELGDVVSVDLLDNSKVYFRVMKINESNFTLLKLGPNNITGSTQYSEDDKYTSFAPYIDEDEEVIYQNIERINFADSSLQKTIKKDFDMLLSKLPKTFANSIVSVNVTQYGYDYYEDAPFVPIFLSEEDNTIKTHAFNVNSTTQLTYIRNYYHNLGELDVYSLSISDIFDFFDSMEVDANSNNLLNIFKINNVGSQSTSLHEIGYSLMDVDSFDSGDPDYYYIVNPSGSLNSYYTGEIPNESVSYCPVFTVDISKFNAFTKVEPYASGETGDAIKIGVSLYKDYLVNNPLKTGINMIFGTDFRFDTPDIHYVITDSETNLSLEQQSNIQIDQVKQMINDGIEHIIVEPVDSNVIDALKNFLMSSPKKSKIYYFGNLNRNSVVQVKGNDPAYVGLADRDSYTDTIKEIISDHFGDTTNINVIYSGHGGTGEKGMGNDTLYVNAYNVISSALNNNNSSAFINDNISSYSCLSGTDMYFDVNDLFDVQKLNPNVIIAQRVDELSSVNKATFANKDSALFIRYFEIAPSDSNVAIISITMPHYAIYNNYSETLEYVCNYIIGNQIDPFDDIKALSWHKVGGFVPSPTPDDEK